MPAGRKGTRFPSAASTSGRRVYCRQELQHLANGVALSMRAASWLEIDDFAPRIRSSYAHNTCSREVAKFRDARTLGRGSAGTFPRRDPATDAEGSTQTAGSPNRATAGRNVFALNQAPQPCSEDAIATQMPWMKRGSADRRTASLAWNSKVIAHESGVRHGGSAGGSYAIEHSQ